MIRLRKEMIVAIAEAVEKAGSQMEFERRTGIRQSTINKIINGKSNSIADRTWRDLLPHLDSSRIIGNDNYFGQNCRVQSDNNFLSSSKNSIEEFRRKLIEAVIDLDIDDTSRTKVLKLIKGIEN